MKKYNIIEVFLEPEGTIFETISLCGMASDHVSKVKVFRGSLHVLAGGEWIPCRLTEPRVRSRFRRVENE